MSYLLYVLSFVAITSSCGNGKNQKKMNDSVVTETKAEMSSPGSPREYESIEIKYWNLHNARIYELKIEKGQLRIFCEISEVELVIDEKDKKNLLIKLVEQFYIEKTDSITLAKVKSEDGIITDYPFFEVKVKNNGELLADERTQIDSEGYEIEYNPKFMELYGIIKELTSFCEK